MTTAPSVRTSPVIPAQAERREVQRSVVLLCGPGGGPGPRERRAALEATPAWDWSCSVVHDGRIDPCLLQQLRSADLVLCTDDGLRAAAAARGIRATTLGEEWPAAERWEALLDHLLVACR